MKNKHLSRAIGQQNLRKTREYLEYKTKLYGISLIIADRFYPSSKRCSSCGSIKKDLKLKDRIYHCPVCGLKTDRDLNASLNLEALAYQ
jgi:putative transposase